MTTPLDDGASRLEGAYEHLATKADLAEMKVDLIKWMVTLIAGSVAATTSIVLVVLKLAG